MHLLYMHMYVRSYVFQGVAWLYSISIVCNTAYEML